eukprot:873958-Prorocentrum_minimum.AAC.1
MSVLKQRLRTTGIKEDSDAGQERCNAMPTTSATPIPARWWPCDEKAFERIHTLPTASARRKTTRQTIPPDDSPTFRLVRNALGAVAYAVASHSRRNAIPTASRSRRFEMLPERTSHVAGDVGGALELGEAEVAHLPDGPLGVPHVREDVIALDVEVHHPPPVQVLHAPRRVQRQLDARRVRIPDRGVRR